MPRGRPVAADVAAFGAPVHLASADDGHAPAVPVETLTFISHGVTIAVRSNDDGVLSTLAARLPTGAQACRATAVDAVYAWTVERVRTRRVHHVTVRSRRDPARVTVARTSRVSHALASLHHDAEFRIAIHAPRDVFIHAGAVAWRGCALLFPGDSFAGKSTLVAELLRRGASYYSDEYAVLDADGLVIPFPRPLHLRNLANRRGARRAPEELGGRRETTPLPVGAVIVARYAPGATWAPRTMTPGQTALALLAHAVDVRARPIHVLTRVVRCVGSGVVALRGHRGEAAVTAHAILQDVMERLDHRAAGDARTSHDCLTKIEP